jgi:hypothetical protein
MTMMNEFLTPLLLETKISTLNSLKEYDKFVSKFPKVNSSKMKIGFLYTYKYDFYTDYPDEILDYFDERPLSLILSYWPQRDLFLGLNFHFLPVLNRAAFIKKLMGMNQLAFNKDGTNKVRVNYLTIQQIMRKSKYCVRLYRPEAISDMRIIPNKEWINTSQYAPATYYKVNIEEIMKRHKNYAAPINELKKKDKF